MLRGVVSCRTVCCAVRCGVGQFVLALLALLAAWKIGLPLLRFVLHLKFKVLFGVLRLKLRVLGVALRTALALLFSPVTVPYRLMRAIGRALFGNKQKGGGAAKKAAPPAPAGGGRRKSK